MLLLEKGKLVIFLMIQMTFCKNCFFYIPSTHSIYYLKNLINDQQEYQMDYQFKNDQITQNGFLRINVCGQVTSPKKMICGNSSVLFMSQDNRMCVNMMSSNQNNYQLRNISNGKPYEGFQIEQQNNQFKTIVRCIREPEHIDPQYSLDENNNLIIETVDACAYENHVLYFFAIHENFFSFLFILIGLILLFRPFKSFRIFICLIQLIFGFVVAYMILYFTLSYKKTFVCFVTVLLFCLLIGLSNCLMFYYMLPLSNVFTFSTSIFLICYYIQNQVVENITTWEIIILLTSSLIIGILCRKGYEISKLICQCFLCSLIIVYSFTNWIGINIMNQKMFTSNFLLTHLSILLLALCGYYHQKDKVNKPNLYHITGKQHKSSILLSLDQLISRLIMPQRQKRPLEIILNDIMEFLSKIMLLVLIYILIMNENELRYIIIKNNKFVGDSEEVVLTILGYVFSHICVLAAKTLIKKFKNQLVVSQDDSFSQREQIKRCSDYLSGILYYGTYSFFLFKFFYKTDKCPEFYGGFLNLGHYSFNISLSISTEEKVFYLIHFGHHIERLVHYFLHNKNSSSFYTMFYHHVLTPIVLFLSYSMGYLKWGFGIFFLFDITEVFLNSTRLFKEIKCLKGMPLNIVFISLLFIWTYNRVYGFYQVIYKHSLHYYVTYQIRELKQFKFLQFYAFSSLYLMNIFWCFQLWKIAYLKLIQKQTKFHFDESQKAVKKKHNQLYILIKLINQKTKATFLLSKSQILLFNY